MPSRSSGVCGRRLPPRSTPKRSPPRPSRPAWPSRRPIRGSSWWPRSPAARAAAWWSILAYALRQILAEAGLSDEQLCGIFTYSTARGAGSRSLAPASAYACLQELHYFGLPGSEYPGEPACKLSGFREGGPVLSSTYLVDFGDDLSDAQFAQEVDRLAAYLLLGSASPAAGFFDQCRALGREQETQSELSIRTAGLSVLGSDARAVPAEWMEDLCASVVRRWQGGAEAATKADPIRLSDYARLFQPAAAGLPQNACDKLAAEQVAGFRLGVEPLLLGLRGRLNEALGSNVEDYLRTVVADGLAAGRSAESALDEVIRRLHAVAGIKEGAAPVLADRLQSLRDLGDAQATALGRETGAALRLDLAADRRFRGLRGRRPPGGRVDRRPPRRAGVRTPPTAPRRGDPAGRGLAEAARPRRRDALGPPGLAGRAGRGPPRLRRRRARRASSWKWR